MFDRCLVSLERASKKNCSLVISQDLNVSLENKQHLTSLGRTRTMQDDLPFVTAEIVIWELEEAVKLDELEIEVSKYCSSLLMYRLDAVRAYSAWRSRPEGENWVADRS